MPRQTTDGAPLPARIPREAAKREFARKLESARIAAGLNQSELARRAAQHMPDGKFGRDNVSGYLRGMALPGAVHLNALAKALHVKPEELLENRPTLSAVDRAPPIDVRDYDGNNAWLKINQAVPWPIALKVMQLIKGE